MEEVLQATSGIGASFHSLRHAVQARRQEGGDENWQPRDGQRYWKAFEVLLAAHEVILWAWCVALAWWTGGFIVGLLTLRMLLLLWIVKPLSCNESVRMARS